jgi:hypothetical protein
MGEAALQREARPRVDDPAVERGEPASVREHDAIPGVRGARVYAEDDH